MTITVGQPVVVKLVTGEELIGKLSQFTAERITLEKPVGVGYQMDPNTPGKIGFGFLPFAPMVKQVNFSFDRSHVVYEAEPNDQLKSAYEQATGAIITPNKSLIVE